MWTHSDRATHGGSDSSDSVIVVVIVKLHPKPLCQIKVFLVVSSCSNMDDRGCNRGKQPEDVQPLAESLVQPLAAESLQQQLGQPLAESLQHVQPLADSLEHGQPQPSAESNQQQDVQPEDVQPENVQPMVVRRRYRGKQPPRSQSLAQPLRKRSNKQERSWANRRVQCFGQRLMCSRERASELKKC